MTIMRAQVVAALAELRVNRPRLAADRMIRGYLQRFGNGASNIGELDPALYEAVFLAVGGRLSTTQRFPVERAQSDCAPSAPPASTRIRTPMTIQLEALLAARAGMPRSRPNHIVNTGNASRSEDQRDDAPQPEYPAGTRMS